MAHTPNDNQFTKQQRLFLLSGSAKRRPCWFVRFARALHFPPTPLDISSGKLLRSFRGYDISISILRAARAHTHTIDLPFPVRRVFSPETPKDGDAPVYFVFAGGTATYGIPKRIFFATSHSNKVAPRKRNALEISRSAFSSFSFPRPSLLMF